MHYLDAIAAFLAAAPISLGAVGSTLYAGELPDSPDACVALFGYGGRPPERGFGVVGAKYVTPGLRVFARGVAHDLDGPMAKAQAAFDALIAIQPDTVIGGHRYLMVNPVQVPFQYQINGKNKDEKNRFLIVCNFLCEMEAAAA
jgi:hypothetical protein